MIGRGLNGAHDGVAPGRPACLKALPIVLPSVPQTTRPRVEDKRGWCAELLRRGPKPGREAAILVASEFGHVLDHRRNGRHARVLGRALAHVPRVDSAVCGREDRAAPEKVGVGLDASHEVLEPLVLDGPRVPRRWVKAGERYSRHGRLLSFSRHLARARNGEGRRSRRLSW